MPDDDEPVTPRFQPVREIARGGMGRVVEALDRELHRTVAVKQALDATPGARRRFAREIEITARLEHPSIVPLYDAGHAADGTPFYVMRKLAGASLEQVIREARTLDARLVVLPNLLAVADAIAHAHGRGVIHRDIKPSNVLVGDLGETIVIDWGLAKLIGEPDDEALGSAIAAPLTGAGAAIGTPGFMAPEQVHGGPVDARADVYALGACLYHVLAGVPPLAGEDLVAKTRAVPGVPPELVTIVETALARDPAARYLDAGGFSEDLRRFLAGQLVASHHYSRRQRIVRWLRRHRRAVIAGCVVAAVAVALGIVSLREIVAARTRAEAALARERDRADDLIVMQASGYLETDPTLAVATLQQLPADSTRWAKLGTVLVEARSQGVAVGYPGHGPGMTTLDLAADGRLVTAANGAVWLDDLVHRTATRIHSGGSIIRARWCGALVLITGSDGALLLDPRTGARAQVPGAVASAGDAVIVIDGAGVVSAIDASHGLPLPAPVVVTRGPSDGAIASPSGRWLIVTGAEHTQILERRGRWDVVATLDGEALVPAFDEGEHRVAFPLGASVVAIELATLARATWNTPAVAVGFAGDELLALAAGEVLALAPGGATAKRGRYEAYGGDAIGSSGPWGVVLEAPDRIAISSGGTRLELHPPHDVARIAVRGRYLVGASAAAVLVWDLAELLPDRAIVPTAQRLAFLDAHALSALGDSPTLFAYRIDEAPFAVHPQPIIDRVAVGAARSLGDDVVSFEVPQQPAIALFDHGTSLRIPKLSAAAVRDAGTLVIGTTDGELALFDRATHATTPLAHLPAPIESIALQPRWIVARSRDGTVERTAPDRTGTRIIAPAGALALGRDGTVYLADGARLLAWGLDPPLPIATFAQPIAAVHPIADGRLAIETADHALAIVDPGSRARSEVLPASLEVAFAASGAAAVARDADRLVVVDLTTGESFPLALRFATLAGGIALAPDGMALVAGVHEADHDEILRFSLRPPAVPYAWVHAATNALPPHRGRDAVQWRSLATR